MNKVNSLTAFAMMSASIAALAHADNGSHECRNGTLEGAYALSITGTSPAPPPPSGAPNYTPGTIEQLIGVGIRTFDGNGTFTQVTNEKGSLSGLPFPDRALQGTYSVNPDCTGTLSLLVPGLPVPIVYDIVIAKNGREFTSMVVSPAAVMVTATGKKVRW
jgi:hypothetical protein